MPQLDSRTGRITDTEGMDFRRNTSCEIYEQDTLRMRKMKPGTLQPVGPQVPVNTALPGRTSRTGSSTSRLVSPTRGWRGVGDTHARYNDAWARTELVHAGICCPVMTSCDYYTAFAQLLCKHIHPRKMLHLAWPASTLVGIIVYMCKGSQVDPISRGIGAVAESAANGN